MGQILSRKPAQDDYGSKAFNIDQQTEKLKKTLDRIGFEEDGTMIICQAAMDDISREFQNLVYCFQAKPASVDAVVLKLIQEVFSHVSTLKPSAMPKESKRKGIVTASKYSTSEKLNKTQQAEPKVTAIGQTQTAPVKSHQLATALEVVRQLPKTLEVLQKWVTSVEIKDGSRMFNRQTLDFINKEIELDMMDSVHVEIDNSIMLPQQTVDTILQHSQEYLIFHEETDSYRQSTGVTLLKQHESSKPKPNELNINQKLEQTSLSLKNTFSERPLKYVQALDPLPSGATHSFITTLQAELEQRRIKLILTDVKSFKDDETSSNLVMVICNNHSRLQANVANTFRDIPGGHFHRVLLAVIHCKKERLLPSAPSKAELKDDKDFGTIPEVVDFAFDKDEPKGGIYGCEFNRRAFEMIEYLVESGRLAFIQADESGSSNKKKRTA